MGLDIGFAMRLGAWPHVGRPGNENDHVAMVCGVS